MRFKLRSKGRGYTAVEVLSAMTLFAIGAAGVIGMQKVSVQGSSDARRFDIASNLANEWLFRLQRDSAFWTKPNDTDRVNTDIGDTKWLKDVAIPTPACTGTNWCLPTPPTTSNADSSAFDVLGRDAVKVTAGAGDHFFCMQYRLNWIANPRATLQCSAVPTEEPCVTGLIRAEVRVFWKRLDKAPIGNCEGVNPTASATVANDYHFVYAATTIRQNSNYPDSGL